jgi:ABC-type uncharacterized transport system ATPase subunit
VGFGLLDLAGTQKLLRCLWWLVALAVVEAVEVEEELFRISVTQFRWEPHPLQSLLGLEALEVVVTAASRLRMWR